MLVDVDDVLELDFNRISRCFIDGSSSIEDAYCYLKNYFKRLRGNEYDRIINITPHDIGVVSSFLSDDKTTFLSKISDWSKYYLNITRHWETLPYNVSDIFIRIAGLNTGTIRPRLQITSKAQSFANDFIAGVALGEDELLIGFNPGASSLEKQWPADYFIELGKLIHKNLNAQIILFGTEIEKDLADYIEKSLPGDIINAAGRTSFMQMAALMSKVRLLVTNDSAPMHVAAASGCKIISIHMGKEQYISTGPYGEGHIGLQPKLVCHPCKKPEECPCMRCRSMVEPVLAFALIDCLIREQNNCCFDDIVELTAKTDAFISRFDERGLLDSYPILRVKITMPVIYKSLLRFMWDISINKIINNNNFNSVINQFVQDFYQQIIQFYFISEPETLCVHLERTIKHLELLEKLSTNGIFLSGKIKLASYQTAENIMSLKELSEKLDHLDENIISTGEIISGLVTLTHMFSFEKENIYGDQIADLSKQTVAVYKNLNMRCKILRMAVKCFSVVIKTTNIIDNKEIA